MSVARKFQTDLPHALREAGLVAAMQGAIQKARKFLDESLVVAERQGARFEHAQTLLARGRVGLEVDWPGSAEDVATARQALTSLGADFALDEAQAPQAEPPKTATLSLVDRFDTVLVAGREKRRALFVERALPGCVMVNQLGRRFVDEAAPYSDIVSAMYKDNAATSANLPAWFIFDATFRRKYPCGPLLPGMVQKDSSIPKDWDGKVYYKAESLVALAKRIGVDATGLVIALAVSATVVDATPFSTVGALVVAFIVYMATRAMRHPVATGTQGMIGASAEVIADFTGKGKVRYGGELWNARSDRPLRAGDAARIVKVEGLTLWVEPQ